MFMCVMQVCIYMCVPVVTHRQPSLSVNVFERSVILPDYIAGLGKAACHKEAFDDVDFLIHGLRQAGGN